MPNQDGTGPVWAENKRQGNRCNRFQGAAGQQRRGGNRGSGCVNRGLNKKPWNTGGQAGKCVSGNEGINRGRRFRNRVLPDDSA